MRRRCVIILARAKKLNVALITIRVLSFDLSLDPFCPANSKKLKETHFVQRLSKHGAQWEVFAAKRHLVFVVVDFF